MKLNGKEIFVHDIENMGKEDLRHLIYELAKSRADIISVLEKQIKEKKEYLREHREKAEQQIINNNMKKANQDIYIYINGQIMGLSNVEQFIREL